ncbi:hypothetical protein CB0940_11081 [Cercospora beticola]|uniref:Uncharacterized protein n=1 Tax=Cercospora beticola TaxID=122368 RepID=A0A2G5HDE8_CERBT|nr:hypothetical protein CB0940_11081 [Cercospora beticola]PIA90584.1 hypothetical protein CB0940_11081 [Cercospora beticola]WPB07909.1 hypothetical protein RHO25_012573 [Cercospora beticola]
MYNENDLDLAAPILQAAFENDPDFGELDMSAGGRLMMYNVEEREEEPREPTPPPSASDIASSSQTFTANNVPVYPATATNDEIVNGPVERIRGANLVRLTKSHSNEALADLVNAAHPSEEEISATNIAQRLIAAYAAAGDDGDRLKREVNDARVGLGLKVRGRAKNVVETPRRSSRRQ